MDYHKICFKIGNQIELPWWAPVFLTSAILKFG